MKNKSSYKLIIENAAGETQILLINGSENYILEDIDYETTQYPNVESFIAAYLKKHPININPIKIYILREYRGEKKKFECIFNEPEMREVAKSFIINDGNLTGKKAPDRLVKASGELYDLATNGKIKDFAIGKLPYMIRWKIDDILRNIRNNHPMLLQENREIYYEIIAELKKSYKNYRGVEIVLKMLKPKKVVEQEELYKQETLEDLISQREIAEEFAPESDEIGDFAARMAYQEYGDDIDKIIAELGEEKVLSLSKRDRYLIGISEDDIRRMSR